LEANVERLDGWLDQWKKDNVEGEGDGATKG